MVRNRKFILVFLSAATVLALASSAYACTAFRGVLELTGNKSGAWPGSPTSKTIGANNGGMAHCNGSPTGYARATQTSGLVDVLVRPTVSGDGCHSSTNKLAGGTYDVNYVNGAAFSGDVPGSYRNYLIDCMSEDGTTVKNLGVLTIDSAGYSLKADGTRGAQNYPLGNSATTNNVDPVTNKPLDESAICVAGPNQGISQGNQGPVAIVV